jgi:hypothetical protein
VVTAKDRHGHCDGFGVFDAVRARLSLRRFNKTQMSPINEMAPIAPQAHFSSGPAFGLVSHNRLLTTSKAKVNALTRGGATFGLVTRGAYSPDGQSLDVA